MRLDLVTLGMLLLMATHHAHAQGVVIHRTTAAAVVEHLEAELLPQGFKLESFDEKDVLFTLDRGMVSQLGDRRVPFAHVVLELNFRLEHKSEGLAVTATEEAVGERGKPFEFRKPVRSKLELDNLQRLLEGVRGDLEAAGPAGDTVVKGDSSHP